MKKERKMVKRKITTFLNYFPFLLVVVSIEINVIDAKSITPIKMICNSKILKNKSKLY
jgi:hypothetical protein